MEVVKNLLKILYGSYGDGGGAEPLKISNLSNFDEI